MFLRVLALCGIFFAYFLGGAFAESSIWGLALVANGPAKFALLTANVNNGHFTLVGNGTAHPELAVCGPTSVTVLTTAVSTLLCLTTGDGRSLCCRYKAENLFLPRYGARACEYRAMT